VERSWTLPVVAEKKRRLGEVKFGFGTVIGISENVENEHGPPFF
jgi:hypothetical protein